MASIPPLVVPCIPASLLVARKFNTSTTAADAVLLFPCQIKLAIRLPFHRIFPSSGPPLPAKLCRVAALTLVVLMPLKMAYAVASSSVVA